MAEFNYLFIENPNAPEIYIDHLHDVQVINGIAHFIPVALRKNCAGYIGEPPVTLVMPVCAVESAVALTYARLPSGVIIPAIGRMAKRALLKH